MNRRSAKSDTVDTMTWVTTPFLLVLVLLSVSGDPPAQPNHISNLAAIAKEVHEVGGRLLAHSAPLVSMSCSQN